MRRARKARTSRVASSDQWRSSMMSRVGGWVRSSVRAPSKTSSPAPPARASSSGPHDAAATVRTHERSADRHMRRTEFVPLQATPETREPRWSCRFLPHPSPIRRTRCRARHPATCSQARRGSAFAPAICSVGSSGRSRGLASFSGQSNSFMQFGATFICLGQGCRNVAHPSVADATLPVSACRQFEGFHDDPQRTR